jgi:hypothetical protein
MDPHELDSLSLAFGLAFASLGVTFLAVPVDVLDVPWAWLWPVAVIALGAALLLPLRRRRDRVEVPERPEPPAAEP